MIRIRLIGILWMIGWVGVCNAQDWIIVEDIDVEGLHRTREAVIRREIPFAPGDTVALAELPKKVTEGERQLMNTGLFNSAKITYANWEGATQRVKLRIDLVETWYL